MGFHPVAVVLQEDTTHKQHTSHKITQRSNETQYTKIHNEDPTQNENTTIITKIIRVTLIKIIML
jgi:hypothetical protein